MNLKIGRDEYEITNKDLFMDNGACVQLMTQAKRYGDWGRKITPMLSKKAIKEIDKYGRIQRDHKYGESVQVFSIGLDKI